MAYEPREYGGGRDRDREGRGRGRRDDGGQEEGGGERDFVRGRGRRKYSLLKFQRIDQGRVGSSSMPICFLESLD